MFQRSRIFVCWVYSCDILVTNMDSFCPCPKRLPEVKMRRFRIISLTKEVSNQPSLDSVLWLTLLKSVLIKHSKLRKKKCKMYGSRGGGGKNKFLIIVFF